MKRTLQIVIIFRFATSSSVQLVSSLERCLDSLTDAETLPVHWSFPLHFLLKDTSARAERVVARLRERGNDRLVPTGFSGAYHSLLNIDELANEVQWSTSNPWGEDTATVFGVKPAALFPLTIDLLRSPTQRIYRDSPSMLVAAEAGDRLFIFSCDAWHALPAPKTASLDARAIVREMKHFYRSAGLDTIALVLDGVRVAGEKLSRLMRVVAETHRKRTSFSVSRLDEVTQHLPGPETNLQSILPRIQTIPTDPSSRLFRATVSDLKRSRNRSREDLTKRRLERLSAFDLDENRALLRRDEKDLLPPRTIIADMYGEVTLSEADLSVRFSHGRITGLRSGDAEILSGRPAETRIVCGGRSLEFTTTGAFSFQEEGCRGLRMTQKLDAREVVTPGQVTIDYSFEDGRRDLQLAVTVAYPELKTAEWIDEYALLEIPLFLIAAEGEVGVEGEYSDGESYRIQLRPGPEPMQLCGNLFRFSSNAGVVRLGYPSKQKAIPEVLPVRFRAVGAGFLFLINPRGSYSRSPAAAFTGVSERFFLTLNAEGPLGENSGRKSLFTSDRR